MKQISDGQIEPGFPTDSNLKFHRKSEKTTPVLQALNELNPRANVLVITSCVMQRDLEMLEKISSLNIARKSFDLTTRLYQVKSGWRRYTE